MTDDQENILQLTLASASPRRKQLLETLGLGFEIQAADIDEQRIAGESVEDMALRLAMGKARTVAAQIAASCSEESCRHHWVLGSDTLGQLDNDALCKPLNYGDAHSMWTRMSGRTHQVITAVALVNAAEPESRCLTALSINDVTFRALSEEEMQDYWASGEPQDKAGGYAIQGGAADWVEEVRGSYSAIVGLPEKETRQLLEQAGFLSGL